MLTRISPVISFRAFGGVVPRSAHRCRVVVPMTPWWAASSLTRWIRMLDLRDCLSSVALREGAPPFPSIGIFDLEVAGEPFLTGARVQRIPLIVFVFDRPWCCFGRG